MNKVFAENAIAWLTFTIIAVCALRSPNAQKSFDQAARNQIASRQHKSEVQDPQLNPLSTHSLSTLSPIATSLLQNNLSSTERLPARE